MTTTVYFDNGFDTAIVYGLHQWDRDTTLEIKGVNINGNAWVQFSMDESGGTAIPVYTKVENDVISAEIPGFVFEKETTKNYVAYAFVYETNIDYGKTIKTIKLNIKARPKPDDYVYTEPEKKRYELLEERIRKIEENGVPGGGKIEIDSELSETSENPVQNKVVDKAFKDLGKRIPTKTSQLDNDEGFLTKHQDLSGYAEKATTLKGYGITDGATKEEVNRLAEEIVDLKENGKGATEEQIQQIETNKNNIETLSKVKSDKSDLVKEVSDRKQSVETEKIERQAEIAVERARINTFTQLEEGSTTGDAELIDARIDADGIAHANVGDAVRMQGAKVNDLSKLILPTVLYKGESKYKGGWVNISVATGLIFKKGKSYTATIELDEIPSTNTYFQILKSDGAIINQVILKDLQSGTMVIEPLYDEEGCYINITSESYAGRCVITVIENDSDKIEKLSEQIEQIEEGYKTFEGIFVHGYNYGSFDKTDKYKAVSIQTYTFNHDITIKCDYGYAFIIVYFNENDQYLSSGTWIEHGEEYVVPADSIFRINIMSKDESVIVEPSEIKLKAQYATRTEKRLVDIERKLPRIESAMEKGEIKFDSSEFDIGDRYDFFDRSVKDKVTNVNSFVCDYDLVITGSEGYIFAVLTYDENDKYKTFSDWKTANESYVVPAGEPFRVSIQKKPMEDVSDIAEYVNAVSYFTEIASVVKIKLPEYENRISKLEKNSGNNDSDVRKFDSSEFDIGERYNFFDKTVKVKVTNVNSFTFDYDLVITGSEGFKFVVITYDENDQWETFSGWITGEGTYTVRSGVPFRVSITKLPEEDVSDIAEYVNAVSYLTETGLKLNTLDISVKGKLENLNLAHIMRKNKYFSHIDVGYYNGLIIPSQSVFDVQRSRRLGFKVMEINVRTTSDGVFYAFHGESNCFGAAFESVDGTDISGVNVSTVTSDYIQSNIRYKSKYSKYRTTPSTVREVLIECKKNEIIPLIQYAEGIVEFTKAIMGENLFFLGVYDRDRGNSDCGDCVCMSWLTGTASQFITKANKSGGAYFCGVNVTDSMYTGYSESDWSNFIDEIHKAGYFVSCAYQSQEQVQKLLNAGIDMMASHGEINDFEHGNVFDSVSDLDYVDFTTNGNVSEGVLTLTSGQTLTPKNITESVFLGGTSLHVLYKGKIRVKMGIVDAEFESDGKKSMWFSSFVQESIPTFLITAVGDTEILELSFKASKM